MTVYCALRPAFALPVVLATLAGCVAPPDDLDRIGAAMALPQVPVSVDGQAFSVAVESGPAGTTLTRAGARPVSGRLLRVMRAEGHMAMDEGALAKKAARAGCGAAGGRFSEAALGRYDRASGAWVFAGGCA